MGSSVLSPDAKIGPGGEGLSGEWTQLLSGLEQNPGRGDLVAGVVSICKTLESPYEQATLLTECSALILQAQPILGLQILRLALLISPRERRALTLAREIFRRRGRFSAEQKVSEILATLTQATAVSPSTHHVTQLATQSNNTIVSFEEQLVQQPSISPNSSESGGSNNPMHKQSTDVPEREPRSADSPAQTPMPEARDADLFMRYLDNCGYDKDWHKFSSGFSLNHAGLVAYVNLLFTMRLLDEMERSNATINLYRMITEKDDKSGAEEIFDRLFMQRNPRKEK